MSACRMVSAMVVAGILAGFVMVSSAHAATVTAVQSGSWLDGTTWSSGVEPAREDDLVIPQGLTVTLPNTHESFRVIRIGTTTISGTLIVDGVFWAGLTTITPSGVVVNNGNVNIFGQGPVPMINNGTLINNQLLAQGFGGALTNNGVVTNTATGSHMVGGTFNNAGTYNNFGSIHDITTFNNTGTLNEFCGGTISGTITGNPPVNHSC
jgi:hypothetical protein